LDSGNLPLSYSISSGSLPPGLSLISSNGAIVGTPSVSWPVQPSASGNCVAVGALTYTFTVVVSNGMYVVPRIFSIDIGPPVPVVFGLLTRTTTGASSWTVPTTIFPATVEVLVVAGGGSGSSRHGGGGGGGGLIYNSAFAVGAGASISITVGTGGAAPAANPATAGNQGGNSIFGTLTAIGGAAGGAGAVGGSGAGGSGPGAGSGGTSGQGFAGTAGCGTGPENTYCGGGGGGAGGAAGAATCSAACIGASGGPGVTYWGVSYAAGGGGGAAGGATAAGAGGVSSGGAGSRGITNAGNGVASTGSGGGGSGFTGGTNGASGAGGSGVVIARWCARA